MSNEQPDWDVPSPIETEYETGQDNVRVLGLDFHNPVFLISALLVVAFVVASFLKGGDLNAFFNGRPAEGGVVAGSFTNLGLRAWLTTTFDWFFLTAGNLFVLFCALLIVTPLGGVRLGGKSARPDYGYPGWFAMLFAAGMGIGLMYFGVSEPLSHYQSSLGGVATGEGGVRTDWAPLGAAAGDPEAARQLGMAATIFHWGLHPWAIYAVVALALAFFSYNRGLPLTLRSAFYPIFGEAVWGWVGHVIDTLAVLATLFGLATSLGYGAEQASAGLDYLFGTGSAEAGTRMLFGFDFNPLAEDETGLQGQDFKIALIGGITCLALISVMVGLDGGVKRLSELNMGLALALLCFVIFVGPTAQILTGFVDGLKSYGENLVALSTPFGREDTNFVEGWTAFYWAWWISWSPFVGMFIARVSRGRTVREFVICVLLIPTLVCGLWMSTFGGSAISQVIADAGAAVGAASQDLKLFKMLEEFPYSEVTSLLGIILVIVFFVTSSDSGSLVVDTVTAGGKTDSPVAQRIFWCLFEGLVAIALLLGGGLGALQAMAVSTGFPFAIVLVLLMFGLFFGLIGERIRTRGE